jgi:LPS export ABC transporter protein LptC
MSNTSGRLWVFLLLVTALGVLLMLRPTQDPGDADTKNPDSQPDYELHGSRIDRLDDEGQLALRLFSDTAIHLPALAGTTITGVTLLQSTERPTPNRLRAPSGFVPDDQRQPMRLTAPVRIEIQDRHEGLPWDIEAGELEYWSQTQHLHSREPVTLTQGESQLEAQALDADLALGQVTLLGKVRARYVR